MELVIAEKPSVARDLARVLGVRPARGEHFENERYAITWCIGHLLELEEPAAYNDAWKAWRLDRLPMLPDEFRLRPAPHAKAQLRAVTKLLKDKRFTSVINACDAGREGELIFRYVYQHARSRLPVRRLWISSLTDDAIRRGFATLRTGHDLDPLADAARSRSEADWLVGMNATRAITTHSRAGGSDMLFSIGRVQTPTLALLVAREREIREFVPRPYWEVRAELTTATGDTFTALWREGKRSRLASRDLAEAIVERDRRETGPTGPRVVALRSRTVKEPPPPLFDLTSLQRTANRRFGFSAARTLELAQALYERHKVVTYPRTDSRHLSSDIAKELPTLFRDLAQQPTYEPFARTLVDTPPRPTPRVVDDSKVHDHHAIIPTGTSPRGSLDRDEARLYDLIVRRFLGAFFPDAELAVTEAWIRVGPGDMPPPELGPARSDPGGDRVRSTPDASAHVSARETFVEQLPPLPDHFFARGRVRTVAGWQEVAGIDARTAASRGEHGERRPDARDRETSAPDEPVSVLPPLVMDQPLAGRYAHTERATTPPPRYSEATLLGAMEGAGKSLDDEALRAAMKDIGLGTPATRAAIIETLLRRKYVERDRQHLVPTAAGQALIATLGAGTSQVATLASPELTGTWEARLARIARGEDSRGAFMADIARYLREVIDAIRGSAPPSLPSLPAGSSSSGSSGPSGSTPGRGRDRSSRSGGSGASRARATKAPRAPGAATQGIKTAKAPRSARPPRAPKPMKASTAAPPTTKATSSAHASSTQLPCPRCKTGELITGSRGWGCSRWKDGCTFVVWFETAGRRLTLVQLEALVTRGKTRDATFVDATGREVQAHLVLDLATERGMRLVAAPSRRS